MLRFVKLIADQFLSYKQIIQILKNVWDTCKFSDEIINGQLEIAKFAVELHSILDGTADKSYLNPEIFLDNTYVTDAIEIVLTNSLLRLSKNQGSASDLLDVSFGGGKTHSLVLLYHIFKNKELGTKFINKIGISKKKASLKKNRNKDYKEM